VYLLAGDYHLVPGEVDDGVGGRQRVVLLFGGFRTTERGRDAREQLAHAERLGDVVVRPQVQAKDDVLLRAVRADDEHRQRRGRAVLLEFLENVQTAQPG